MRQLSVVFSPIYPFIPKKKKRARTLFFISMYNMLDSQDTTIDEDTAVMSIMRLCHENTGTFLLSNSANVTTLQYNASCVRLPATKLLSDSKDSVSNLKKHLDKFF